MNNEYKQTKIMNNTKISISNLFIYKQIIVIVNNEQTRLMNVKRENAHK